MQDLSLLAFRQSNEAACGVAALRYLFSLTVWPFVDKPHCYMPTEENLKTNYVTGTEPAAITAYLDKLGVVHHAQEQTGLFTMSLPAMILYQWGGEGHYGVVVKVNVRSVWVFNPYNSKIDRHTLADFLSRWHDKPEFKWSLTIGA